MSARRCLGAKRGGLFRGGLARRAVRLAVAARVKQVSEAGPVPDEWYEPLIRAAVREPDPSFVRGFIEPAVSAFGRRRVRLSLLAHLENGPPLDAAGAARAWYWTGVPLCYVCGARTPTAENVEERARYRDLDRRYADIALRRFVADDDLRRCVLPGLDLTPEAYPADLRPLVTRAVHCRQLGSSATALARSSPCITRMFGCARAQSPAAVRSAVVAV